MIIKLAKFLMNILPVNADAETTFFNVAQLIETPANLYERMYAAAQDKYDAEQELSFAQMYLPDDQVELFRGKRVLDFGCSVGGRGVAFARRLQFSMLYGVDILQQNINVAERFARDKGVKAEYRCGRAEALPFEDASMDVVWSYDTFEHVENLSVALRECARVLVPGGMLVAVFPPFYNPFESHLVVSRMPFLHWFLSGETLTRAQYRIALRRGCGNALPQKLSAWEKLPSLNGTRVSDFDAMSKDWKVFYRRLCPLFTTGRLAHRLRIFGVLRKVCAPLVFVPVLRELFTDRVVCVLQKPA